MFFSIITHLFMLGFSLYFLGFAWRFAFTFRPPSRFNFSLQVPKAESVKTFLHKIIFIHFLLLFPSAISLRPNTFSTTRRCVVTPFLFRSFNTRKTIQATILISLFSSKFAMVLVPANP